MGRKQDQEQTRILSRALAGELDPAELATAHSLLGEGEQGAQLLELLTTLVNQAHLRAEDLALLPPPVLAAVLYTLMLKDRLDTLVSLRDTPGPKGVQKAAGQILHQAATRGIKIPERSTRALIQKVEEPPAAWASYVGLDGERSLDLYLPGSDATLHSFILSEDQGIRDFFQSDVSRGAYTRMLEEAREQGKAPPLGIPFPHALYLLEEALATSTRAHRAVDLSLFALVRNLAQTYPPRAHFPTEILDLPPLTGSEPSRELIALLTLPPVLLGWRMKPSHLEPMFVGLEAIRSAVVIVSPEIKKERLDDVIRSGVRSFFSVERRRHFRRRLEELALLLPPEAAFVLPALGGSVAALAQEDIDILDVPFATGFVQLQFFDQVRRLMPEKETPAAPQDPPEPPPLIIPGR